MVNLEIAYGLIAVVLIAYGLTLYRRSQAITRRIREMQEDE